MSADVGMDLCDPNQRDETSSALPPNLGHVSHNSLPESRVTRTEAPPSYRAAPEMVIFEESEPAEQGPASPENFLDEPRAGARKTRRKKGKAKRKRRGRPTSPTSYWSSDEEEDSAEKVIARSKSPKQRKPSNPQTNNKSVDNSDSEAQDAPPISIIRTTKAKKSAHSTAQPSVAQQQQQHQPSFTLEDMEIFQRLDEEYDHALEEREIGYMARYTSVRQAACISVLFMLLFLMLGTTFFRRRAEWTLQDSLLFSVYTITTVGYGNSDIPKDAGFQSFTILYIFVGIATLTIMVAQVYQCIALETARAQHARDRRTMARQKRQSLDNNSQQQQSTQNSTVQSNNSQASVVDSVFTQEHVMVKWYERAKRFFLYNEYGRSLSVLLPFAGLVSVGACFVGIVEGWNGVEALYFAVVSLTTVGFGDYTPQHTSSICFCILWLPFSAGFMSMFLQNVATFYIGLSTQNINRIERRMRKRLARAKEQFESERAEVLKRAYHGQQQRVNEMELQSFPSADSDDLVAPVATSPHAAKQQHQQQAIAVSKPSHRPRHFPGRRPAFDALPTNPVDASVASPVVKASRSSLFGSPGKDDGVINRRQRILKNSLEGGQATRRRSKGQTMETMKDVIEAVHKSINSGESDSRYLSMQSSVMKPVLGRSNQPMKKPSFALRALVQERFAEIIATDIAGYQSSIEIEDNTLAVTIDSLRYVAEKWSIPGRARKAFRAVAFEALYFVGEHGLITRGADALYALTPFEFHGLFGPLLAAMGDASTMQAWLASTEVLAEYDLRNQPTGLVVDQGDLEVGTRSSEQNAPLNTAPHKSPSKEELLGRVAWIHGGE
ncbi:Potassium channel subfamily K member [Seminavis robusta]|uniref:Potassium channel subfamily K member n=1 Tax=Seminavis robusta TaxID=568900 RepID=A0A9N8HRI4_9STRA|nr:Potassium channel subfamily K member [Seminavis robusta]|eukprot:Sro1573_g283480.1 Potassium channel subfamily K member (836) ;mRNA; r:22019-24609